MNTQIHFVNGVPEKENEGRKEKYLKSYFHKGFVMFDMCWPIQARLKMTDQILPAALGLHWPVCPPKKPLFLQNLCYGHIESLCGIHQL